jgi:hypothetical protein
LSLPSRDGSRSPPTRSTGRSSPLRSKVLEPQPRSVRLNPATTVSMSKPTRRRSVRSEICARIEAVARSDGHRCKDYLPGRLQDATAMVEPQEVGPSSPPVRHPNRVLSGCSAGSARVCVPSVVSTVGLGPTACSVSYGESSGYRV